MVFLNEYSYIHNLFYSSSLEKNEYNYITATYYLLAEQKMRVEKQKKHEKNTPGFKYSLRVNR